MLTQDGEAMDGQKNTETNWVDVCRAEIVTAYKDLTPTSQAVFKRACKVLPGGASGNLRYFSPYPLYMTGGYGCRTIDVDGREYIDCFSCNGPLLLGHQHPNISEAVSSFAKTGSLVVNPELIVTCAEALQRVIPSAERVRFVNSGTEAVMSAIRYARAFAGKDKIVKFYGHYHGQDDQFLLAIAPNRDRIGDGVPSEAVENTLTVRCNDTEGLNTLLGSRTDIAAIIIDPAMHSGGLWPIDREFLLTLRALTEEHGIVLIFDEVITGFRMGLGGAQEYYGVQPDLTTLAKALGAGEKLGAIVGRADIMAVVDPLAPEGVPRVFQSGTGNDGTMALAATVGAIAAYEQFAAEGEYQLLWARVEELEIRLRNLFSKHGIGLHVNRLCSMMQLFISDLEPSYEAYAGIDNELLDLFYLALLTQGVMLSLPTSNHVYFSFMHDQDAFDAIIEAAAIVLEKYPFAEAFQQQLQRSN